MASAYVLADTADKGQKMNKVRRPEPGLVLSLSCDVNISVQMPDSDSGKVALAAFDTLVWQAFASVIVPGSLSNQNTFIIVDNVLRTEYRHPVKFKLYYII